MRSCEAVSAPPTMHAYDDCKQLYEMLL